MRIKNDSWIINMPIAHRGLWGDDVPENSLLAYQKAAEKQIPIEIDIYLTKDNKIVSFHDKTLKRMTGAEGNVFDYTYDELKKLKLNGSEYTIPIFTEVLSICENKSPILIEIKDQPNKNIVEEMIKILKEYKGEFAIQSFNPLYIRKVKKLAPEYIRGILATQKKSTKNSLKNFILKHMPLNFIIKPDFISYNKNGYPLPKRKTKNKRLLAWTILSTEEWDKVKPYVDNIIYEKFEI